MAVCGIDVGSRTIKVVVMDQDTKRIREFRKVETTYTPVDQCLKVLNGLAAERTVATGYGRKLLQNHVKSDSITEILAHALGAGHVFPESRSVLDIGGQDTKAISLDSLGRVAKFEMNDRCAAGTGKFLEFMATSFQIPVERFGDFALEGKPGLSINSMCTVFAESEATSLMAQGHRPRDIALALHQSVVKRSLSMLKRVSVDGPLVFSGGVAMNLCVRQLVEKEMKSPILVAAEPDMVGALGAALYAAQLEDR
ncbi:MAG: 3-hydroxyacyl-ACP dehydratase [Desulfomonile tiedjei]|uniref:3-hydroxyacyl-ACP dehydratase n=1 Tax=Desulfomonile tiedjei TaxID=2358 RepID=A0A9D6V1U1_9BACT|nr:3-hydroxyacyl-ACP dehydratase [Desulfomonile tiedjei]